MLAPYGAAMINSFASQVLGLRSSLKLFSLATTDGNGSAREAIFCGTWGLFIEIYEYGEYMIVDYGFGRFCVCCVAGHDNWVWRSP